MTTTDRTGRRRELGKLTKPQLIRICTRGVRTPDGSTRATEGGMYPLSAWRKDEIVNWIISAEYGPLPSETGRDWQTTNAAETCDDAPADTTAAACLSCSRGEDGGGYPCDCPEACGARYCQHPPTETVTADTDPDPF
jgi:hypothetical protein